MPHLLWFSIHIAFPWRNILPLLPLPASFPCASICIDIWPNQNLSLHFSMCNHPTNTSYAPLRDWTQFNFSSLLWVWCSTHQLLLCGPSTFASATTTFEIVPALLYSALVWSKKSPRMNLLPIFLCTFYCSPAVNIRDLLSLVFQKVPGCVFPTLLLLFLCLPLTFLMKRVAKPKTVDPRATRP